MGVDPALIERIYEAAALPARWPGVLQDIADQAGSRGAVFVVQHPVGVTLTSSPAMEQDVADYFAAGWRLEQIAGATIRERYPGFRCETDYMKVESIHRLPVHAEFFDPRGYVAGASTVIQGASDDLLMCILEGFPSHPDAAAAKPWLDQVRAPLARAFSLSARLAAAKAEATVTTLSLAGVAAAIVSRDGRLRASNDRFAARLGDRIETTRGSLRFADRFAQGQLGTALAADEGAGVRSIAIAGGKADAPVAAHLLPLRREARNVFGSDGVLILLAEPANATLPGADLLRLLFDLTPSEARLTRLLTEGHAPADAAHQLGIREMTARTHLRNVFAKTGVRRQTDLIRLLLGIGAPEKLA